jgi:tRNA-Thr(GGU) m(6)t(6)A37 methyltransferase TsaA
MDSVNKEDMHERAFTFRPIGLLATPYRSRSGVPIQGVFDPDSQGKAKIFEAYEEGLKDLEGFSHIILIYVFHRSKGYDLVCRPYMEEERHGVFAMRAPRRPNPIGFSVVRLLKREGRILHLSEVDMLDGTPILDIKPFAPKFDHREDARVGWMTATFRDGRHRKVSDDRF